MADRLKRRNLVRKLRDKYRLAIFNEHTYEEVFGMRLSLMNVFTSASSILILFVIGTTFLIAFTGLREYIPGYPSPQQRRLIIQNAQRVA